MNKVFASTQDYIKSVTNQPEPTTLTEKFSLWVHEHPTINKAIRISLLTLGVASIVALPVTKPALGAAAVVIAVVGGIVAAVSALALKVLDMAIPPTHEMTTHTFTPGTYLGATLSYENHVPVLSLNNLTGNKSGQAQGYLLAPQLDDLRSKWKLANRLMKEVPNPEDIPILLRQIEKTIPAEYLEELRGVVEGYNRWNGQQWIKSNPLTFDELLIYQLIPDSLHLEFDNVEQQLKKSAAACTSLIHQDKKGIVFGRNMDWMTLGVAGKYTLLIRRTLPNGIKTAEVSIPGIIGTLTGMNNHGLSLAMNVCPGTTLKARGMPAIFMNRKVLETCSNVKEVDDFVNKKTAEPIGPFHMTIADAEQGASWHFYQASKATEHVKEPFVKDAARPLMVLNQNILFPDGPKNNEYDSIGRRKSLQTFFDGAQKSLAEVNQRKLVRASLALPKMNTFITAHTVMMLPGEKRMLVRFNNALSASGKLRRLSQKALFG